MFSISCRRMWREESPRTPPPSRESRQSSRPGDSTCGEGCDGAACFLAGSIVTFQLQRAGKDARCSRCVLRIVDKGGRIVGIETAARNTAWPEIRDDFVSVQLSRLLRVTALGLA